MASTSVGVVRLEWCPSLRMGHLGLAGLCGSKEGPRTANSPEQKISKMFKDIPEYQKQVG